MSDRNCKPHHLPVFVFRDMGAGNLSQMQHIFFLRLLVVLSFNNKSEHDTKSSTSESLPMFCSVNAQNKRFAMPKHLC